MQENFIVYETTQAHIYKSGNKQILECVEDGSQFIFHNKIGAGSFSKVKLVERCSRTPDNQETRVQYAIKIMQT